MSSNGNGNHQASINPTHEILKPRAEWIVKRKLEAARTGDGNMSQMHFARVASRKRWPMSPSGKSCRWG